MFLYPTELPMTEIVRLGAAIKDKDLSDKPRIVKDATTVVAFANGVIFGDPDAEPAVIGAEPSDVQLANDQTEAVVGLVSALDGTDTDIPKGAAGAIGINWASLVAKIIAFILELLEDDE